MKRFLPLAILAFMVPLHAEPAKKKAGTSSEKKAAESESENVKEGPSSDGPKVAAVSSIEPEDLDGFKYYAPQIQELIRSALALTKLNLTYTFGSSNPKNGGMDCSGTIYHVLSDFGFKGVPRQSDEMAGWVQDKTLLHRITDADALTHPEFAPLQPGNLLFWTGTYVTAPRKIPVTHVMLYLGKLKKSGKHVVFGASDGRAYQGQRRTGVSVFDFSLPKSTSTSTFYGYGMIPGVGKIEVKPKPLPPVVIAETKPEAMKPVADAERKSEPVPAKILVMEKQEEVRPAVRVERKSEESPKSAAIKSDTGKIAAESAKVDKKADAKPASEKTASVSKMEAEKPKSVTKKKATPSKSSTVVKKKSTPPPEPPGVLARAKQATESFLNDVRRALPKGQ